MTDAQLLEFALGGGLRSDCTATQARLDASLHRLKQLLLVFGDWPSVATALQHQPELLGAAQEAVEGLLNEPQQQMWRLVVQQLEQQLRPQ